MIKEFTIGFSRTINLGNYESARVEASVKYEIDGLRPYSTLVEEAQADLRKLLEDTWKAQFKPSNPLKKDNGK